MIERECQEIARYSLDTLKAERIARRGSAGGDDDPRDDYLTDCMGEFGDALREQNFNPVREEAAEIIERLGVTAPEGSAEWVELCIALLHAHAEIYHVERERHRGNLRVAIAVPLNPALSDAFGDSGPRAGYHMPSLEILPARRVAIGSGEWPLAETAERFLTRPDHGWTAKTGSQHRASLALFRQFIGNDQAAISGIDRSRVADFKATIEKLPASTEKRDGRSLNDIIAEAEATGAVRLTQKTVKRHMSALTGLFRWAKEQGRYGGENPAAGFKYPRTRRPRDERAGWTPKQLEALFRSPIWAGCASGLDRQRHIAGPEIIRDHRYWLPLLGAYAGLRLEEACQLHVGDIGTEGGIPFIDIRPGEGKQLKSKAAVRRVPIHPVLMDAGFLRHVADAKRRGDVRLFSALRPGGPDKRFGYAETKRF